MHARRLLTAVLISALNPAAGFLVPAASLSRASSVFAPSLSSSSSTPSRPLATTTASSGKRDVHGSTNALKMSTSSGEILEPQGKHYPWYSMAPLSELQEFGKGRGPYFKKCKEANGGTAIFKIHPGIAMIAITDHASTKWFFEQPDTVLDRQDGAYFGPFKCTKEYVGDSLPALITNTNESHAEVRKYMIDVMRERVGGTEKALRHATDNFYSHLKDTGLGEYPTVYGTFLQQSHAVILEWALGTGEEGGQPLPPFKDFINVNPADLSLLLKLECDTPIANMALQTLQATKGGATKEQKKSVEVLLESITTSKAWPRFMEVLKENKVPITQPERSFMFTTGFQSSSPIAKNMESAVGVLDANPDFLKDLQNELDGHDLTMDAVSDLSKFPLLDSLHWEILRMYARPPFFVKKAKMDLVAPTSNGDRYQIKKGDMLFCQHTLGQIDELKFGPDAKEFNPRRFVGNPDLKKDVFAFGYTDSFDTAPKDGMPWGCVGHALGIVDALMKVIYGRWVQEYTWELTEPAVIDQGLFLSTVGPVGMTFSKITPRK